MPKKFTVTDGKLVLFLEPAEKGWYAITSPFDPELITQAKTLEDAFIMAYDAQKCLRAARAEIARKLGRARLKAVKKSPVMAGPLATRRTSPPRKDNSGESLSDAPSPPAGISLTNTPRIPERPLGYIEDED